MKDPESVPSRSKHLLRLAHRRCFQRQIMSPADVEIYVLKFEALKKCETAAVASLRMNHFLFFLLPGHRCASTG